MTRPVWAEFEGVWSARTPNSLVHILEGESFSVRGEQGHIRTRCGRTLKTDGLDRAFSTRSALSEPHRNREQRRRWCDRCVRTMQ